jgi:hypothetical protein
MYKNRKPYLSTLSFRSIFRFAETLSLLFSLGHSLTCSFHLWSANAYAGWHASTTTLSSVTPISKDDAPQSIGSGRRLLNLATTTSIRSSAPRSDCLLLDLVAASSIRLSPTWIRSFPSSFRVIVGFHLAHRRISSAHVLRQLDHAILFRSCNSPVCLVLARARRPDARGDWLWCGRVLVRDGSISPHTSGRSCCAHVLLHPQ